MSIWFGVPEEIKIYMIAVKFDNKVIKPVFSGHETFPLRYGWLKKVYDSVSEAEKNNSDAKDVFNNPESISSFGVGKNMVSSMRHWATYTGVLEDNKITKIAKAILADDGLDPWMENPTTLWILHWMLAKNKNLITYYWFFNHYNGNVFDRKFLNNEIDELCLNDELKRPSVVTLKRDVECFIRMYVGKDTSSNLHNDESIESPLVELSLVKPVNKQGFFRPNRGVKSNLTIGMLLLSIAYFWEEHHINSSTLSLESLLFDPESPGRIFLLDESAIIQEINKISERFSGIIEWSDTAGMRQFTKSSTVDLSTIKEEAMNLIKAEYSTL